MATGVPTELSVLSPAAADDAARTARAVAAALGGVEADVDSARRGTTGWWGPAQQGFDGRARRLLDDLSLLTRAAAAGATAVEEHAAELGMLAARLRTVDAQLETAERRTRETTGDLAAWHGAWSELQGWQATRARLLAEHDESSARLAQRLLALVADVEDRPRTLGEHVGDAVRVLVGEGAAVAYAAAGWVWDRHGWAAAVRAAPGAALDAVLDPAGTAADALHLDDARDGRWGAVAGGVAAGLAGRGAGRAADELLPGRGGPDERPRAPDGDLLPQTLDEMLAGVDLERSEGPGHGHTLERHVDVDDEYLEERLTRGTPDRRTGARGGAPAAASRWSSLEVAERTVTEALRENEAQVRQALAGKGGTTLRVPVDASAGTVLVRDGAGSRQVPAEHAVVVLRRDPDGVPYVLTSYLGRKARP
ncbi:RNase A-like domain-containing protein [Kineococcus sp. SYSU DK018]|uniref:RNase A-like domain-containing protein n=1 Tax=Kineococcus sp. SYSU DK018 TaxID=3383139 RepID=UPI003D7E7EAF